VIFSTVGTILGGIWANGAWGRFWGWDPKENGALLIVISQLAILHARMGGYLREHGVCMAVALRGHVIAFSWCGVNLLGVGLHSYGFTQGIHTALMTYYYFQWGTVGLGGLAWVLERRRARAVASAAQPAPVGKKLKQGTQPASAERAPLPRPTPRPGARPSPDPSPACGAIAAAAANLGLWLGSWLLDAGPDKPRGSRKGLRFSEGTLFPPLQSSCKRKGSNVNRRTFASTLILALGVLAGASSCASTSKEVSTLQGVDDLVGRVELLHFEAELSKARSENALDSLEGLASGGFRGDPVAASTS
jgi:hypothetical protein